MNILSFFFFYWVIWKTWFFGRRWLFHHRRMWRVKHIFRLFKNANFIELIFYTIRLFCHETRNLTGFPNWINLFFIVIPKGICTFRTIPLKGLVTRLMSKVPKTSKPSAMKIRIILFLVLCWDIIIITYISW